MRRRWTPRRTRVGLFVLAAVVLMAPVSVILFTSVGPSSALGRAVAVALVAVQVGSFAWMRDDAERSMAVALAAGIGLQALCPKLGMLGLANLSLCALAAVRPPRISLWALGFMLALSPWPALSRGALAGLIAAGGPVLSWSWGELLRTGRDRRRGDARRAVAEERARIARELHDVVAHNVSLIVVQAVAAEDVFDARPDQSREALRAIEASGRAALTELRRLLGTVRPDARGNGADPDAMDDGNDPQPGLAQLETLVGSVRAAGLEVTVRYEGAPVELPAGVDLSAYRIVQEALTNTLRHAQATRAAVTVRYVPAAVEVEVCDDGRGAGGGTGGGHGIVGMRERVALLGGALELGPSARQGFRVYAVLPVEAP